VAAEKAARARYNSMIRLHESRWPEASNYRSSGLLCAAAGPAARSGARTGPDRHGDERRRPKAALDPSKETPHELCTSRHVMHMRRLWCQVCSASVSAGTSAVGKCWTREGTFCGVEALGGIGAVVDGGSNRECPEAWCRGEFLASPAAAAGALSRPAVSCTCWSSFGDDSQGRGP
jgi:hypothetical protein